MISMYPATVTPRIASPLGSAKATPHHSRSSNNRKSIMSEGREEHHERQVMRQEQEGCHSVKEEPVLGRAGPGESE